MDQKTEQLLQMAAELYRLGIAVEKARKRLKDLVEQGIPYTSEEMLFAMRELQTLDGQWKQLETQYLALREGFASSFGIDSQLHGMD